MKRAFLAAALSLALAACSKVTQDNFAKINDGMAEAEVIQLLGKPDESSGGQILGLSGVASTWYGSDAVITVKFVNGKVRAKSIEPGRSAPPKPAAGKG